MENEIAYALLILCLLAIVLSFVLLLLTHIFRRSRDVLREKHDVHNQDLILQFVESGDRNLLVRMRKGKTLRNQIVRMSSSLHGTLRLKLMMTYVFLGYAKKDFAIMQGLSSERRMQALLRCRALGIPMPDDGFEFFMRCRNRAFRWAAMEYLIHVRGRKAVPAILNFLSDKNNQRKGIAVHLFSELAVRSPDSIPFLLEHTYVPIVREALLIVLRRYPVAGADRVIIRNIIGQDNPNLLVAAIHALAGSMDDGTVDSLCKLAEKSDWPVRVALAQALVNAGETVPKPQLRWLLEDISYAVRRAAVKTLLLLYSKGLCSEIVDDIIKCEDHPSYYLLNQYMQSSRRALAS